MHYNKKRKEIESLGSILGSLLKDLGLEDRMRVGRFFSSWEEIVGEQIARHAKPVEYRRGILVVSVDSSAWLAELSQYMKAELLKKLRSRAGDLVIKDIRFKMG